MVSVGSVNEAIVHPREVFCPLVALAAYAFIIVHNHPSGAPTPSKADKAFTRRLAEAAAFMEIYLLDHVIVGDYYFSFKEAGLL